MVSSMRIGRNVNYRILDIDWCTSDKVVLASDDGCVRVLEMAMKSASYRMDEQDLTGETGNQRVRARCDWTDEGSVLRGTWKTPLRPCDDVNRRGLVFYSL